MEDVVTTESRSEDSTSEGVCLISFTVFAARLLGEQYSWKHIYMLPSQALAARLNSFTAFGIR